MKKRRFGTTQYETTVIGLGGMPLSLEGRPSEADGVRVIHASLDAGVRLIDTADVYCIDDSDIGHNERLIATALSQWSGPKERMLVATKGGLRRPKGAWTSDASPAHLRKACEQSLRSLGVERIAVYQLHAPDDDVPLADSVGELARLRDEGKIEHVGLSNVSIDELRQAQKIVAIASVQNRMNPFDLRPMRDGMVALCEAEGIAFVPYSPVGGWRDREKIARDATLVSVAQKHNGSPFEVALAWILTLGQTIFPIPGASRIESAVSSARAASIALDDADVARLDRAFGHRR